MDDLITHGKVKAVSRRGSTDFIGEGTEINSISWKNYDFIGERIEDLIKMANGSDTKAAKILMAAYCGAIAANNDEDGKPYIRLGGAGTQFDERILRYFGVYF